jgi:hypothetical protein
MKQPPSTSVLRNLDLLSTVAKKKRRKPRSAWGNTSRVQAIQVGGSGKKPEAGTSGGVVRPSDAPKITERARLVGLGME